MSPPRAADEREPPNDAHQALVRAISAILKSLRRRPPRTACHVTRCNHNRQKRSERMKLNSAQVERTLSQFDAQALPDNHPVVPQLNNLFGDHTFFLDRSGLNVLEPTEAPGVETQTGKIVNLAYWSDENLTKLTPHEPEPTGVIVSLEPTH